MNAYNNKHTSRATGFTPNHGRLATNRLEARTKMLFNAKRGRKYPNISVGDAVKVYNKRPNFSKERVPVWSANSYQVLKIEEDHGQKYYYLAGRERPLLRHEILLAN